MWCIYKNEDLCVASALLLLNLFFWNANVEDWCLCCTCTWYSLPLIVERVKKKSSRFSFKTLLHLFMYLFLYLSIYLSPPVHSFVNATSPLQSPLSVIRFSHSKRATCFSGCGLCATSVTHVSYNMTPSPTSGCCKWKDVCHRKNLSNHLCS